MFAFGQLRMHDIATSRNTVHELRVSVAENWKPSELEYDPNLNPRFINGQRLALSMPWGDVEVVMPLPAVVTLVVDT